MNERAAHTRQRLAGALRTIGWRVTLLAAAAVAVAVIAIRDGGMPSRHASAAAADAAPLIAVLPFAAAAPAHEPFGLNFSQDVRSDLQLIRQLRAVSASPGEVHGGASHVLSADIDELEPRVRIRVRLRSARTDAVVWTMTYDEDTTGIFRIRRAIVDDVAGFLGVPVQPADRQRLAAVPATSFSAYRQYLLARHVAVRARTAEQTASAADMLARAIHMDSAFAPAHAQLAGVLARRISSHGAPRSLLDSAYAAARRAVAYAPQLGEAAYQLARVHMAAGSSTDAAAELERAIRLDPGNVTALLVSTILASQRGRPDDVIHSARLRLSAQPWQAGWIHQDMGAAYSLLGMHAAADSAFARAPASGLSSVHWPEPLYAALRRGRTGEARARAAGLQEAWAMSPISLTAAGEAYLVAGRTAAARRVLERAAADAPDAAALYHSAAALLGLALLIDGDDEAARNQLARARDLAVERVADDPFAADPSYALAAISAALGARDEALSLLADAEAAGFVDASWLQVDPFFQSLRADPRYQHTEARMRRRLQEMRSNLHAR